MSFPIKKVLIYANREKREAISFSKEVIQILNDYNIDHVTKQEWLIDKKSVDLIISIGGDGTVLACVREIQEFDIPIIAINMGTLGYITEINKNNWIPIFVSALENKINISKRMLLEVIIKSANEEKSIYALNEAVLSGAGISRLLEVSIILENNHFPIRADGLIISSPTGSTAYSVAAGGPIVNPEMEAIILTPICPFSLSTRPIVIPPNNTIQLEIHIKNKNRNFDEEANTMLTIDGQKGFILSPDETIQISKAKHYAQLIVPNNSSRYSTIRNKLRWYGGKE